MRITGAVNQITTQLENKLFTSLANLVFDY